MLTKGSFVYLFEYIYTLLSQTVLYMAALKYISLENSSFIWDKNLFTFGQCKLITSVVVQCI